ncbi:hypothetical protein [Corynebacterium aquilae]|nr:hypothetical protein [Corynebacterium aquilae]
MSVSRRFVSSFLAASLATSTVFLGAGAASAYDVTPDLDAGVCRVDPRQKDSDVSEFWTKLREDAVNQRLEELDHDDPGLKEAIHAYDMNEPGAATPAELQERIKATGSPEGLGMFIPHRTEAEDGIGDQAGDKMEYTPVEARAAARAISDEPSNAPQDALNKQAATSHLRIDEITAELFSHRHKEYDRTQFELRDNLNACADDVEEGTKPQWWAGPWGIVVGIGAVLALVVVLRGIYNSRKPNRHHKTN